MLNKYVMQNLHIDSRCDFIDKMMMIICILMYGLGHYIFMPPQVKILIQNLGTWGYFLLGILVFVLPAIIVYIINTIHERKKTQEPFQLSFCSSTVLVWFFIISFPLNLLQLVLFIMTTFLVFIGIRNWFPLVSFNKKFDEFVKKKHMATQELVAETMSGLYAIFIALLCFLLSSIFQIYPVLFLLLIYLKYPFKKIFFHGTNEDDHEIKFYKNWKKMDNLIILICLLGYGIVLTLFIWVRILMI